MAENSQTEEFALRVLEAHRQNFDLEIPYHFAGQELVGYGAYHAEASSYVLSKKAKLWEISAHEYLYVVAVDHLDEPTLDQWVARMKTEGIAALTIDENHMSSYLSLVIITSTADPAIARSVKRCRYRKNFCGGWRGWADLRIAVAVLSSSSVYCNRQGRLLGQTLETNLQKFLEH